MSKKLQGKVAVVTGASKGIGAAIAAHLAEAGASVVVNYASSREGADRVVAEIESKGGKAIAVQGDVSKEADAVRLLDETVNRFGRVDVLVNNAGVYEMKPIEEMSVEHFHKQYNVNVLGLLLATREAVKRFGKEGGSIVNISSTVSTISPPNASVYAGTKGAVDVITASLAKELGPRGIRVNAVNPGLIDTEGVRSAGIHDSDMRDWVEATAPLGRIGQVGDIAPAVVFLASDDAKYITGEALRASGGL
ncbi:MAG: SDR family NAD(P)-dependent oxidoreductase [Phycisphaerales bacterium]